jgi:multidrug resistance protein
MDKSRSTLALLALAVSAFAIGTTEFISVGLLPLISKGMHVSVTTAGLTVTLYALGVTFGAPILTPLTANMSRKSLLLWIMIIFIVGNVVAACATSIEMLLFARVLAAFSHGVFMSIATTIAADVVPEDRRASAIAFMFTGLTIAIVTGVPLGTFIGQQFGWRAAFIMIVAVGIIAFVSNMILVPSDLQRGARTSFRDQLKLITNGRLLLVFIITALGYGGTFVVFTYLSPLLQDVTGFKGTTVAAILLVYGVAIAIGNVIGGKVANRNPVVALFYMFIAQAIVLFIFKFTAPYKVMALGTVFLMGLFAFMNVPGLQHYVVVLAKRFVPGAVDMASAINIAAFNGGIAIGSFLGGVVTNSLGLIHTTWIGALMVLGAVFLTSWSMALERNHQKSVIIAQ